MSVKTGAGLQAKPALHPNKCGFLQVAGVRNLRGVALERHAAVTLLAHERHSGLKSLRMLHVLGTRELGWAVAVTRPTHRHRIARRDQPFIAQSS